MSTTIDPAITPAADPAAAPPADPAPTTPPPADDTAADDTAAVPVNVLPGTDAKTVAKMAKDEAGIAKIVKLCVATLDDKGALGRYAKIGKATVDHATWRKANSPAWTDKDYSDLCRDVEKQVRFAVPVDVEADVYVRVYAFVEAVRPMVPGIDALSFNQVRNKFLPTLAWSRTDLTGEIRAGWVDWVRDTVAGQVGDKPMNMDDLTAAIKAQADKVAADKVGDQSAEQLAESARKAEAAKRRAAEAKARKQVTDGVDKALTAMMSTAQLVLNQA